MKRRTYLTTASVTATIAIAGCTGDGIPGDGENDLDGEANIEEEDDVEPEQPERGATFDDFEDIDAWEVVVGTLQADEERASVGSRSAHLKASESESQARIKRRLSDPIDIEEVVPGLALATSSSASPILQLHDDDGNYLQFQQYIHEERPFIRHDFGHTHVSGDPDLGAITEVQIGFWTGDEHEGEIWVDDLHFTGRVKKGRVMIQFQGGYESDYTEAFPIMEAHDLTATTFVATARIREREEVIGGRMTEDQLAELADAGWSIGTVGARGRQLNRVETDEFESHLLDPLEWFDEHGYDDARYFGFPGGWYTEEMYDLVAENYDIAWGGRHRCQGIATNPYNLTRISGNVGQRNLDAEEMIDALDWAADHGGITTIVFYEMDQADATALEETASHLADLVSTGDLELITPREIADEYVL